MAYKNVVDDTSTANTAASPGWTVDLRNHTTHRLRSQGVPVRFKVCVNSTAGNDTGAIKLVDETGAAVLTCLINNPAATTSQIGDWYWADGYVPATLAKYDVHYGGNTSGSLTVFSASLYEIDWTTDPVTGSASMSLDGMTVSSSATAEWYASASVTLDALTVSSTGAVEVTGAASMTLGALSVSATGTVADPAAPAYQALGTGQGGSGGTTLTTAWPTHIADDVAILVVVSRQSFGDPGAATLSTANGFTAVTGGSDLTDDGTWQVRTTLFWCRATSSSMASPVVATDTGNNHVSVIITFRGCTTSGDPTDGTPGLGANSTSNTSVTATGLTTSGANRAILVVIGYEAAGTTASYSNSNLTGITERMDSGPNGDASHIVLATATAASAGAIGNTTATISTARTWTSVVIALKP